MNTRTGIQVSVGSVRTDSDWTYSSRIGGGRVDPGRTGAGGTGSGRAGAVSPIRLAQIVRRTADRPELWRPLIRFEADQRWYAKLSGNDEHEVWLLTWLPGQQTGFHDHGDSRGAFTVASGSLTEQAAVAGRPEPGSRKLRVGAVRSFGTRYVHDVRNDAIQPAVSIHAYSPPLSSMRRFEVSTDGLLRVALEERSW